MDDLDRKILTLLTRDGRLPSAQMARMVGASERTVANRVNRLIESGAISIIGVVSHEYFGYEVIADIFCEVDPKNLNETADRIAELPEVSYVAVSFGDRDISIQAVAKSTAELYEFVSERLTHVPGVERTRTVIVPRVVKDFHEWLPPEVVRITGQHGTDQEARNSAPHPTQERSAVLNRRQI